ANTGFIQTCALSHDTPGWLLLKKLSARNHILVIGAGWGRQLELLIPHFDNITAIEFEPRQRHYLSERLQNASTITIQSPDEFFAQADNNLPLYDLILARTDFLAPFSSEQLISLLDAA